MDRLFGYTTVVPGEALCTFQYERFRHDNLRYSIGDTEFQVVAEIKSDLMDKFIQDIEREIYSPESGSKVILTNNQFSIVMGADNGMCIVEFLGRSLPNRLLEVTKCGSFLLDTLGSRIEITTEKHPKTGELILVIKDIHLKVELILSSDEYDKIMHKKMASSERTYGLFMKIQMYLCADKDSLDIVFEELALKATVVIHASLHRIRDALVKS